MRVLGVAFGWFVIGLSTPAQARMFADSLWESPKLDETVLSAGFGDVDQDFAYDLVFLSRGRLSAARFTDVGFKVFAKLHSGAVEEFHRVSVGDFDGDAVSEVLLNGFRRGEVFSRLYRVAGKKFVLKQEFNALVLPFVLNGRNTLLSQSVHPPWRWGHDFTELTFDGGKFVAGKGPRIYRGIGDQSQSLFALVGMGENLLELSGENRLRVWSPAGKRLWQSGLSYGGAYDFAEFDGRDPLGVNSDLRYFIPPRMAFEPFSQTLQVVKNDGYIKSLVGAIPVMKSAQIVSLRWDGERLQETATLPHHDGAITDVVAVDFNQDGLRELLVVFLVRKLGYLDALRTQDSIIAVLPMPVKD